MYILDNTDGMHRLHPCLTYDEVHWSNRTEHKI